ncbi:hypothetical protein [Flexivirga caeni]|nr:hypothetical protein [Flexivirga caeni]
MSVVRTSGRRVGLAAAVMALAVTAAGCSSSGSKTSTPQGLTGHQAKAFADKQISALDASAATVLRPKPGSYLAGKKTVTVLGSTTPANGDENPYAILPVTRTIGSERAGDVLVDNFNNRSNFQGTGTTIVDMHPKGSVSVFANLAGAKRSCPGGVGLTTAMVQLKTGWIIVGSLPSTDGVTTTAGRGCLLVVSPKGKLVKTISAPYLNGPWDATVKDDGDTATLFVDNTLVGLKHSPTATAHGGNVVRLTLKQTASSPPTVTAHTVIASGYGEAGDPTVFVKGPTGLLLGSNGTLYVADNVGNRVQKVPNALTRTTSAGVGTTLTSGGQLSDPLGMTFAPGGDLLVANARNGKIVEVTPSGEQVGEDYAIENTGQDPAGSGDLFDLAIDPYRHGVLFVKDDENTLALLH